MKYICPLIAVKDIQRSRTFHENVLGQKVKMDFGENVTFEGDFAIHLISHFEKLLDGSGAKVISKANNGELYFEAGNIRQDVEKIIKAGTELLHPLREQPWRQLVIRFYDPDGHIIELGESFEDLARRLRDEGLDDQQIAEATSLPLEFVKTL